MISVILATFNEKDNIIKLIQTLFDHCPKNQELEIIVVDDNSQDNTAKLVKELHHPQVKLIERRYARGLASAFNRGIIESRGDYLVWMDADMCMPPALIPKMYKKIDQEGYDVVIGSRYAHGGQDDRQFYRTIASRLINGLARLILGYGIKDYDSGFIFLRRSVLNEVSLIPYGYGEYFIEFVYNICQRGFKVTELGYYFRDRSEGQGSSKSAPDPLSFLRTGFHYVIRIFHARFRIRR